jgi:hypothetical protein
MAVKLLPSTGPLQVIAAEVSVSSSDRIFRVLVPWPVIARDRHEEMPVSWEGFNAAELEAVKQYAIDLVIDMSAIKEIGPIPRI